MAWIEFAPLNISLERRLQTLSVIHYIFFFLIAPPLSVCIAVYLLFTSFWWITVLYMAWFIYDFRAPERGSRPSKRLQNSIIWKYFADYFPQELIKTADLSPENNYIIGAHPHGIISIGSFTTLCTNGTGFSQKFPGITSYLATLNGQFWFPFRREYILLSGAIACCRESITYLLNSKKGLAVGIVLGGAEEILDSHHNCYRVVLTNRKGFIKIALETGAHLVPMYNFGETDTYKQVSNERGTMLRSFQVAFHRYAGFSPPIICGRGIFNYTFGILPFRTPIHTVVGRPIPVEKVSNPTAEQIDALHETYRTELQKLFNEHKTKYGISEDAELHFY